MKRNKFRILLSSFLLVILVSPSFLVSVKSARADANKTITITFATTPTSAVASKAQLKFNKKFAYSYSLDDGLDDGYDPAFTYLNGGNSAIVGQYFGGLYFTDGAGNNVPFRGGYAFYSRNLSYSDLHLTTPSYIRWSNLQIAVDNGWDVFNHGYTSSSIPENDPNKVYYTGDPGGHATGTLDYAYELSQLNVDIGSRITLRNNSGATTTPLQTTHVILPNGDDNYIQPAFDNGYKGVYSQDSTFVFDGATTTAPRYTNVNSAITSNRHVMPRWFANEARYLGTGEYPGGLYNHVDGLASISSSTDRYWAQEFTHQITTSNYAPDWNGGITWSTWKNLMDHVENTYGRFGDDSAWVAGAEEVYDYMMVKQNAVLNQNLVGNQLTVEIDTTSVPANLRHYALSLLVSADASISSISYGTDFTYHSDNTTTGLINVDWGVNSYSKNDITRVEALVSAAEASSRKSDIDIARIYNNLLVDSSYSTTTPSKTAFTSRLDAIVVPLRTWYVNVRGIGTLVNCNDSNGATTTKTYAPSPYNWNLFTVGSTAAISCGDLLNIRDSDNQVSTLSLSNTAPFKTGNLQSNSTGNNSGIYPDAVISTQAQIYAATNTPAKIKISGLEGIKTYNIKLFGYTSATGKTGDSATTQYTIASTTQELIVKSNLTNTVEFLDILPVNGEIEITIAPKVTAWGYGMLNAFEIKENLLTAPSALSYNSPNTYIKGSVITPLSPAVTGQGITYSVSPDLPSGLSINTSTGVISGTPNVANGQSTYTVTATNTGGSTSFGVVMTVNNVAPSSLSYDSPNIYTKGTAITPLSPTVTGEGITYSVSPSLPSGLSLDIDTGIISGTPNAVASQATYTVTATNSGGSTSFGVVMTVNYAAPTSLSYNSPNVYRRGDLVASLMPTVTGEGITYSVSPNLPSGLSISTSTGIISGTPSAASGQATYTVTATNSGGSTSFGVVITINNIYFTLTYLADANGSISGSSTQVIVQGSNGSPVAAVPNVDYYFLKWSDNVMTATRTDTNILSNKSVTAQFALSSSNDNNNNNNDNSESNINSVPVYLPPAIGNGGSEVTIPMGAVSPIGVVANSGVNVLGYINSRADFTTPESSNNWQPGSHSLQITNLDLYYDIITLFVSSKPQTLTLKKGESRELDLDGDKKNDVIVTFVSTYVNRAEVTIKSLAQASSTASTTSELIANKKPIITATKASKFIFTKDLKLGTVDISVKELQKYLNNNGYPVSKSGVGSKGRETNIFGFATKAALIKFQKAKKINPAMGYFGAVTRKEMNK